MIVPDLTFICISENNYSPDNIEKIFFCKKEVVKKTMHAQAMSKHHLLYRIYLEYKHGNHCPLFN